MSHLTEAVHSLVPGLVVISGDFTQVATENEFKKAQSFIQELGVPVFCVPGNHDVPRYNLADRFLYPYRKYKDFISTDLSPVLTQDNFIIAGLNTARRALPHWNWANGAISSAQLVKLDQYFKNEKHKFSICVMHHPIHKAAESPLKVKVFGAQCAIDKIHELEIDLVLTGHVHHASITVVKNTVFASASTAISHRLRTQENGFNVIDFEGDIFEISHFVYNGEGFLKSSSHQHKRNA